MSHILINKWRELQVIVEQYNTKADRTWLLSILYTWMAEIKQLKDPQIRELYSLYLAYFEEINFHALSFSEEYVWYSLDELIQIDLLSITPLSYERPIIKARDIMWELLVFKSNQPCPCCGDDDLRIMMNRHVETIFGVCDICNCLNYMAGDNTPPEEKLYPVSQDVVKKYGILPNVVHQKRVKD